MSSIHHKSALVRTFYVKKKEPMQVEAAENWILTPLYLRNSALRSSRGSPSPTNKLAVLIMLSTVPKIPQGRDCDQSQHR